MSNRATCSFLLICAFISVSLSLVFCYPVSARGQAIQLQVTPSYSVVGDVKPNTLSCTVEASLTSIEKVTSITLYTARPYGNPGDLDPLATIDLWTPGPQLLNDIAPSRATVIGQLGTGSDTKSQLIFSWQTSRNSPVAWYKCVANGLDRRGNTVTISMSSDTGAKAAVTPGKLDRLTDPQLDRAANSTARLEQSAKAVDASLDLLHDTIKGLEEQVRAQNATIASLVERISSFIELQKITHLKENFDVSDVYKGSQYYASKQVAPFNIRAADDLCSTFDSYLVEIDDEDEFDFVFNFLKGVGGSNHFFTGGNDLDEEGSWRFWHSKRPVEFFKWGKNEPNNSNEHCIEFSQAHDGYNDRRCNSKSKFVCETRV